MSIVGGGAPLGQHPLGTYTKGAEQRQLAENAIPRGCMLEEASRAVGTVRAP
jgi:hypothetical protein